VNHPRSPGRGPRLARPLGLGRKPRLARPPLASGASSASPDPSRVRAPTPLRPSPQNKASSTRHPYPRRDRRSNSHIAAGHGGDYSNHPGHCSLTSCTMLPYLFHCGVLPHSERGMGEINQRHYWLSSPTITGQAAVSPIRPPQLQQGSATLHRSNYAVSHASRTGWTSLYSVKTVAPPLTRGKSLVTHVKTWAPLRL